MQTTQEQRWIETLEANETLIETIGDYAAIVHDANDGYCALWFENGSVEGGEWSEDISECRQEAIDANAACCEEAQETRLSELRDRLYETMDACDDPDRLQQAINLLS